MSTTVTAADTVEEARDRAESAFAGLRIESMGRDGYRVASAAITRTLQADLARLLPSTVPDMIWSRAWEDGHSEGYLRVVEEYESVWTLVSTAEARAYARGQQSEMATR